MCTVMYIPVESGAYMCSVRDENPLRQQALYPEKMSEKTMDFWAPIDPQSGGTWWAVTTNGNSFILLNGAFHNHLPNTRTYFKSRGTIIRELCLEQCFEQAWEALNLADIEPFTLIAKIQEQLIECRWNGRKKFWKELDRNQPGIWSSATLYPLEVRTKRERAFFDFVDRPVTAASAIETFLFQHAEPQNGFIMHRHEKLRSLSVSIFDFSAPKTVLYYHDLLKNEKKTIIF